MGSQELAFDDEMSLDENHIIRPTSGFDESPTREIRQHLNDLQFRQATIQADTLEPTLNAPPKIPELTEEAKQEILNKADFSRFFRQSTRIIERALAEDVSTFF